MEWTNQMEWSPRKSNTNANACSDISVPSRMRDREYPNDEYIRKVINKERRWNSSNWHYLILSRENFLKSSPLTPKIVKTRSEFTWEMSTILWMTKNDHCYFCILFHFLQFEQYISISLFLVWEARLFKNLLYTNTTT